MSYSGEVLADSPLVYFRMPRSPSNIIYSQGSKQAALCVQSATTVGAYTGVTPDAGSIVAATQYQSIFGGAIPKPYSLECWAWTSHQGSAALVGSFLTANPDQDAGANPFGLIWVGPSQFKSQQPASGGVVTATRTPMAWAHLVVTVDGTNLILYVNGSSAGSTADHTTLNSFSTQVITNVSGFNNGIWVAEIAFYTVALSSGRVAAHHSAGSTGSPPMPISGLASCS